MTQVEEAAPLARVSPHSTVWTRGQRLARTSPVAVFLLLSALFGALTVAATLPLRGPDEPAHFLRAYGILTGEIIPTTTDASGRKGVWLPAELYRQMYCYSVALTGRYRPAGTEWTFPQVLEEYVRLRAGVATGSAAPVFVPYDGSEGYSPAAYLAMLPGLALARLLDLDFVATIYLMRGTSLLLLTGVVACAIAIVPALGWAWLLIAMLPSALFSRAMLSADASSLAYAMMVAALSLRGAYRLPSGSAWMRSVWMTLCVLGKPPQIVFVLAEALSRPVGQWLRYWRCVAVVVAPALVLGILWPALGSADAGAWRIVNGISNAADHFRPLWKLGFWLEHPLHFPTLLLGNLDSVGEYWRQLIGVLGWLDLRLQEWVYPALSLTLAFGLCAALQVDRSTRRRLALVSGLIVLGYCGAVFMIFYLVWTPLDGVRIEGVQGRYFVPALPFTAIMLSAALPRAPSSATGSVVAIFGALLSGVATLEAIFRCDWQLALLPP
ncbi:MAG: DUF2142 domain-containing protein [Xanthobacteraceae bacterium]